MVLSIRQQSDKAETLEEDEAPEQRETKGSIQVIERMMSLLDALAETAEPATLKSLAQATGLHPSTAHRILAAMGHSRLVQRHDANTYILGIRLLELGNIVKSRLKIRDLALPFMRELHETIGEAINLGIRDDDEIIYLERYDEMKKAINEIFDMPNHVIDLLIKFLEQNEGKLSKRAKEKEFRMLSEQECFQLENIYKKIFLTLDQKD